MRRNRSSPPAGDGDNTVTNPDVTAIEIATGLSIADVETLSSNPPPELRADIAGKFIHAFDRLAQGPANSLTYDLLKVFAKDQESLVRMRVAEGLKASPHLPAAIAERLARDEIDVASPILLESPVLEDEVIADILETMPEIYALAVADRHGLSQLLSDVLIEQKGTKRVVSRLLDNDRAKLSDHALHSLRKWGRADPDIEDRLQKRPDLPFALVDQCVMELADKVRWPTIGKRTMTKSEATLLHGQFEGRNRNRSTAKGEDFQRLHRAIKTDFERGFLTPSKLLAFLRDRDIDRLECAFAVMTGFNIRWVRSLLYGSDRRGLIALCLKAKFNSVDYLAFRMALSLAEFGTARDRQQQRYSRKNMEFARDQFERMRADPLQLKPWSPPHALTIR